MQYRNSFLWAAFVILFLMNVYLMYVVQQIQQLQEARVTVPASGFQNPLDNILLADVSGGTGKGSSFRAFDKGLFVNTVSATLPKPAGNSFYEAWLIKEQGSYGHPEVISAGKLTLEVPEDQYWVSMFSSQTNYRDYASILVTLQSSDDAVPQAPILKGSYQQR